MSNSNLKVLFLNIFLVLFTAARSSVRILQLNLIEIETTIKNVGLKIPLVPEVLTLILSCFVVFKFILSYLSLAAHIVALYPILNYELNDLLIPTIIMQAIQNILLNLGELWCGYIICHNYLDKDSTACSIFYIKILAKCTLGIIVLNVFWNYYSSLRYPELEVIPNRKFHKRISQKQVQDIKIFQRRMILESSEVEMNSEVFSNT
ncbi:uncharacterized protein LOC129942565 [Eupeodes corollae]|uniref:uncharacterized protein LOC129942565 n=1 Tax=Eupeodes corollae TaxID=290404 RepID=UPI00248F552E|nr:uncharacterized protein LOC129942565 [Eupeodes corollae]